MSIELTFSGGAGYFLYQLGIVKALIHIYGKEQLKKYCYLGGVSSGAVVTFLLLLSCESDKDIDYWYFNYISKILIKNEGIWSCHLINNYIKEMSNNCLSHFEDDSYILNKINERYFTFITQILPYPKTRCISEFDSNDDLSDVLSITTHISYYTDKSLFRIYKKSNNRVWIYCRYKKYVINYFKSSLGCSTRS